LWLTLQTAWRGLLSHRLRTLLTMSGIVVGVAALIATLAIEGTAGRRKSYRISLDDWRAIQQLHDVKLASPVVYSHNQVVARGNDCNTAVRGVSPEFLSIFHLVMDKGRPFTLDESTNGATVALLGSTVAEKLFGGDNPVDKSVRIGRTTFTVIGVMQATGNDGTSGDDVVLIPVATAAVRLFNNHVVDELIAEPKKLEQMDAVCEQIVAVLGDRNHSPSLVESHKAFEVRTSQQMMKTSTETSQTFSLLIFLTASLSLFVGGIGIMNTMMMAVHERIREIGIRAALGSRPRDILTLFLSEALMLTLLGGGIGVFLGTELSIQLASYVQWPPVITLGSILLALGCATSVGLVAGIVPAYRASRLEPLECLRAD
jgi:putative ABC transport system permease protein